MKKFNILIYPSGAENAIEVYNSIKDSVHINVIPASAKHDHSELIYENALEYLPYIQSERFLTELNNLIQKKKIDYIFPTHDSVALHLAEYKEMVKCGIIGSEYKTNQVCRHKRDTYKMFRDYDFCPEVFHEHQKVQSYPIFTKPNVGEGSKGAKLVNSLEEHLELISKQNDLIFVEYLPGNEYTIDCFTDKDGNLRFVGPRERVEVKMGISFKSELVQDREKFYGIAEQINRKLSFRGLWFFQLKEDTKGALKLLEISTRVAGTMGFFRHKGVNLPLLSVFDAMGFEVKISENNYDIKLFRSTINRYKYSFTYKRVYLDFDDTLIVNKKVNPTVIAFVYQCKNLGKEIILITKHAYDLDKTLNQYGISGSLFDKVIILESNEIKSAHIDADGAIFIDNWYKERMEVKEEYDIPVFDVDAVRSLLIN